MKGTDQVLAIACVDASLAADRGIHLRQQRRRHLNEVDTAQHRSRDIAGQVTHDPTAEGKQHVPAFDAEAKHLLADVGKNRKRLAFLAARYGDQAQGDVVLGQSGSEGRAVRLPNQAVRDNRQPPGRQPIRPVRRQTRQYASPDVDRVGPFPQADFNKMICHRRFCASGFVMTQDGIEGYPDGFID